MGPEQQQEFKSEKPLIKQQRKTIPFTDNSIENWKPKKPRERSNERSSDFLVATDIVLVYSQLEQKEQLMLHVMKNR